MTDPELPYSEQSLHEVRAEGLLRGLPDLALDPEATEEVAITAAKSIYDMLGKIPLHELAQGRLELTCSDGDIIGLELIGSTADGTYVCRLESEQVESSGTWGIVGAITTLTDLEFDDETIPSAAEFSLQNKDPDGNNTAFYYRKEEEPRYFMFSQKEIAKGSVLLLRKVYFKDEIADVLLTNVANDEPIIFMPHPITFSDGHEEATFIDNSAVLYLGRVSGCKVIPWSSRTEPVSFGQPITPDTKPKLAPTFSNLD